MRIQTLLLGNLNLTPFTLSHIPSPCFDDVNPIQGPDPLRHVLHQFELGGKTFQGGGQSAFGGTVGQDSSDAVQQYSRGSVLVQWKSFLVCVSIN
ncbi:hypothetical protein HAX54_030029 [Datura stramonium]|uniref:Uncharacterized protein n=1 Tax=Datura stramonium TaxID=4076 RepID=A0ABS8V9D0_DATST|nr:hypothetical protein [Datura stramonium]